MKNILHIINGTVTVENVADGTNRIFLNDAEIDLSEWTNTGAYKIQYAGAVFEIISFLL